MAMKGCEYGLPKRQKDGFYDCSVFGGPVTQMEVQQAKDDSASKHTGNELPLPSFNDVLLAQNWATAVVQQTEEEANKRGRRGSRAWEDVWRDALWTLAVQKRCVEVEARRHREAMACQATKSRSSSPPTKRHEDMETRRVSEGEEQRKLCEKRISILEAERDDARQRLREVEAKAEELARQMQPSLNEKSSYTHSQSMQCIGKWTREDNETEEQRKLCEKTVKLCEKTVRVLEVERDDARQRLREVEAQAEEGARKFLEAEVIWQQRHESLQKQLQCEELEIKRRCEAEEQRKLCEKTMLALETERDDARKRQRELEAKAEDEARKFQQAEAVWQQRHASLQKQLRRSELSNGFPSPGRSQRPSDGSETIMFEGDSNLLASRSPTGELETLRSPAILDLLREVRSLERQPGATNTRDVLRRSKKNLNDELDQVNWL